MIAYFDTSAIVPLLIDEGATDRCTRLWNEAERIVGVRLLYPETCAALARAKRMERLTAAQMTAATADLDEVVDAVATLPCRSVAPTAASRRSGTCSASGIVESLSSTGASPLRRKRCGA